MRCFFNAPENRKLPVYHILISPSVLSGFLLQLLVRLISYERFSKELIAEVLEAAAVKSYQHAIDSTKQEMSRQTVHNRLVALDDLVMPIERVKETPEILDIFADEDHVHLTPKGQAIVPLVTITEGIDISNQIMALFV